MMLRPIALGVILLSCCRDSSCEDWYRFRGPRLDGVSRETNWPVDWVANAPRISWKASVGKGLSSVSIRNDKLYTIGNEDNVDTVFCLDVATGQVSWSHAYPSPTDANEFDGGPTSTPTVEGDQVYTLGRQGDLICFDKDDGDVVWSINVADVADVRIPTWGFSGSPLAIKHLLLVNVGDSGVAVDRFTGELIWKSADKDSGYSSVVPMGDNVVFASARSYVGVDPMSGREVWRQRWLTTFGCNAADPIIDGDRVFLSSGYNRGAALLSIKGEAPSVIWKNKEMQNQIGTSVLVDGFVYGVHGDVAAGADVRCIDLNSGEVRWTSVGIRAGALSAAGDKLILISDSGELIIAFASASKFDLLARQQVLRGKCWTAPVLSNGRIYCRSADGEIVCVDVR